MQDFEESFSNYLESKKGDRIFDEFYHQIKMAFKAGYLCGGGQIMESDKVMAFYQESQPNEG